MTSNIENERLIAQCLIPRSSGPYQVAYVYAVKRLLAKISTPFPHALMPDQAPKSLLPYLAQDRGVANWIADDEQLQRNIVASWWQDLAFAGTPYAIETSLKRLGIASKINELPDNRFSLDVAYSANFSNAFQSLVYDVVNDFKNARTEFSLNLIKSATLTLNISLSFKALTFRQLDLISSDYVYFYGRY